MVVYSVTISLDANIEAEWVEWMKQAHIPDVLRTKCFSSCRMFRVVDASDRPSYVMQYECASLEEYHRYRDQFAPALQKEHSDRYAGQFQGSRQVLEEC